MNTAVTVNRSITLKVWDCPSCGVIYGVTEEFANHRREHGGSYYCPNGHVLSWKETELERVRRELANEQERRNRTVARLNDEIEARQAVERSLSATKGVLTRTRKRVANGVCPCCHRTFVALGRHMKSQHPDYVDE